jgi:hypothetical protein
MNLQSNGTGSRFQVPQRGLGTHRVGRIEQHGDTGGTGSQFAQEPQPFCPQLRSEKIDAGGIAARAGKAGDKTELNRVLGNAKDDRNQLCCGFRREGGRLTTRRGDHCHPAADQVGSQLRQPINMTFRPAIFDRHVFAR